MPDRLDFVLMAAGVRYRAAGAGVTVFRLVLLVAAAVVLSVAALSQAPPSNVVPVIQALQHRDFSTALKLCQSILAGQPENFTVWTLRGMASAGLGDPADALTSYRHALRFSPSYLPALEGAAQSEFQLGRPEARASLLKILAQRPDDATTHMLLGMLDFKAKKCEDAAEHFAKADPALGSRPEALNEYGTCLGELKRFDKAVAVFTQALSVDSSQRDARYNLALAQWQDNKPEDALETLRPMVESAPVSSDGLALSAEILEARQNTVEAVDLLRKAILADPKNVDAYLYFASLSFDHASPQAGIDILNAGLTQLPNEPRLYLVRGILLTQLGEFAQAAQDFETASRINPRVQFLGVAEGLVESQVHHSAQALAKFRAAVKVHPTDAYAQYLLAEALEAEGKQQGSAAYKEEMDAAGKAVQLDPKLVAARDLLASIDLENGQTAKAIEQSEAALKVDPNDQQAVYHLIVALRKTDRKDQIPGLLKRLMELRAKTGSPQPGAKQYRLTVQEDANEPQPR